MEDREHEQESSSPSPPDTTTTTTIAIAITLIHHSQQHTLHFDPEATITDLASRVEETLFIPTANQKLLVPKLGLLKAGALPDPALRLAGNLTDKKITLMGTSSAEIASLHSASQAAAAQAERIASARRQQRQNAPKAWPSSSRRSQQSQEEDSTYTFATLRPLPHLPNPQRSLAFLERLQRDPGIRAAMRAHKFRVGLLAEMDPIAYTEATHEGTTRILGLNRNAGEVIELRLRTDAYDGYRDYRTIRKTLCHELAHNVHGPHDRKFWDLCHQIEREVDRGDWKGRGGRAVGGDDAVYYEPVGASEEVAYDHGGWTGGEFVLGGGGSSGAGGSGSGSGSGSGGAISRREIIAKAVEERLKTARNTQQRQKQNERDGDSGSSA